MKLILQLVKSNRLSLIWFAKHTDELATQGAIIHSIEPKLFFED